MTTKAQPKRIPEGEVIFGKIGLLVFLGILLLGIGAQLPLWTAAYRAFFVWLVYSLLGGGLRVGWKYHLYRMREQDLQVNLDRARQEEERLFRERRERRDRMGEAGDLLDGERTGPPERTDPLQEAMREALKASGNEKRE